MTGCGDCDIVRRHQTGGSDMATSIRLSPDDERRVALLAEQTGRSEAYYLREIVERGLEDMRTTTSRRMCWSASTKGKSKYTAPRM